jgi:hypothetical protein
LSLPLPSLLTATLIAITMALSTLSLIVAAIIIRRTLLLFVVAYRRGCVVASLTLSCQPPPALFAFSIAIALVAVACLPPLLPSLLPPLPLPSFLHATLVSNAMACAALALFVDRHPHCHYHHPVIGYGIMVGNIAC